MALKITKITKAKVTAADLLTKFQSDLGDGIGSFGGPLVNSDRIPTGLFELDLALGGGFPRGKVSTIYGPESSNKCHAPGTPILMHDGTAKVVELVRPGDHLMGPDSKPRLVLQAGKGFGPLYRISPSFGEPFVVNDEHVLVLKRVSNSSPRLKGEIVTVSVKDWLAWSKTRKSLYKLWRPQGIDLPARDVPLDPYFLGLWLGDGSSAASSVTTGDEEIETFLHEFAAANGWRVAVYAEHPGCRTLAVVGDVRGAGRGSSGDLSRPAVVRDYLELLGVLKNKHVPDLYLRNSRDVRAKLLAGLLDADGGLQSGTGCMMFGNTKDRLIEAVQFLGRSLGLRVTRSERTCKVNGVPYTSGYLYLTGDFSGIPLKIERKRPSAPTEWKDRLTTGFTAQAIGEGDFYGFQLDGDHLYLAGDFIVHHNTNIALRAIAMHQLLWPHLSCVFVDLENEFNPDWARALGVNTDKLIVLKPAYAEQCVDLVESLLYADDCGLIVMDSLAALVNTTELEKSAEGAIVGGVGVTIGKLYRKTIAAFVEAEKQGRWPSLFYINQITYKIGVMFGNPETMPGGKKPWYQSALILRVYGNNIIDPKISKVMPVRKEVSFVVKKFKVPIIAASGKFEMVTQAHKGLEIGQCNDFSTIKAYLENFGEFGKAEKKGWLIKGEVYEKQDQFKERLYFEPAFGSGIRQYVIDTMLAGGELLDEGEAAPGD